MRLNQALTVLLPLLAVVACAPQATVIESREKLWAQYGNKPLDNLLVSLGTPEKETKLTDGSRMVMYQFNSVYESGSPYERQSVCQVTVTAKPARFVVDNVAMKGDAYACSMLADGHTGSVRRPAFEPNMPYNTNPPAYLYRYRY